MKKIGRIYKKRIWHGLISLGVLAIMFLQVTLYYNRYNEQDAYIYTKLENSKENPTVFMQFYDWFEEESWVESSFVDPIDWEAIGIADSDRTSEEFYYKMFSYMKSLGVDAISWEFHPRKGVHSLWPSENAISALRRSGLKIACFYDYEMAVKVQNNEEGIAVLAEQGSISAEDSVAEKILADLKEFYDHVPNDLLAYDKEGRQVVYVYGYDFDDSLENMEKWDGFAEKLIDGVSDFIDGEIPAFYWTCKNSPFEEHLYQHYANNFIPFQFVLDTPQSQFSASSVTWNLGYDNLGVQVRDNLQRVIRLDERYVKEMGWLSAATDCDSVFIYSWNEPFEGAMAIPTEEWGDTKAQLVKQYIERLKSGSEESLKKTILIVDDLDNFYKNGMADWHYVIEREMLLYAMRRYLPQADVYINTQVTADLLQQYECIVDISVDKDENLCKLILKQIDSKQVLVFDPKVSYNVNSLNSYFITDCSNVNVNDNVIVYGEMFPTYARDDLIKGDLTDKTKKFIKVANGFDTALGAVKNDDDMLVSLYNNDDRILKMIFEEFYQSRLSTSILYGEGYSSQRLEISADCKEIVKNIHEKYSINGHWEIPENIQWDIMPEDIPEDYYNFIFYGEE